MSDDKRTPEDPSSQEEVKAQEEAPIASDDEISEQEEAVASEESSDDTEDYNARAFTPKQKKVNFSDGSVVKRELTEDEKGELDVTQDFLPILCENIGNVDESLKQFNDILTDIRDSNLRLEQRLHDDEGRLPRWNEGNYWERVLRTGIKNAFRGGGTDFSRENSQWDFDVDVDGTPIRIRYPKPSSQRGDARAFIEKAKDRSNFGRQVDVPLLHSGFWVRLSTPSNVHVAQLQQSLADIVSSLGANEKGLAFSATSHSFQVIAMDFALQCVDKANVQWTSPTDLKTMINHLDLPILLHGLLCSMYPAGYNYAYPCVADPVTCQHVVKECINLSRLFRVDSSIITDYQKQHMRKKFTTTHTEEELQQYRENSIAGREKIYWTENGIGVTLKTPTLYEFEVSGQEWIDNIHEMVETPFNEPPDSKTRREQIERLGTVTRARQYRHFVKDVRISHNDDTEDDVSEEEEAIVATLGDVFSSDEAFRLFANDVLDFIASTKMAVIAIPSFNCPECNTPIATEFNKRFPHLVELDVIMDFFTLTYRKLL